MHYALVEVNLSRPSAVHPGHAGAYKLLSTSTDRERLSRAAATFNRAERNPYILYRTLDYATAVERIRGRTV
jgi:hypothetical protein